MTSPISSFTHSAISSFVPIATMSNSMLSNINTSSEQGRDIADNHCNAESMKSSLYENCVQMHLNTNKVVHTVSGDSNMKGGFSDLPTDNITCYQNEIDDAGRIIDLPKKEQFQFSSGNKEDDFVSCNILTNSDTTSSDKQQLNAAQHISMENFTMEKVTSHLFDTCSVAHKKKFHYQREVWQQQQKNSGVVNHKDSRPLQNTSPLLYIKKDTPSGDIRPGMYSGTSYFPNLPLHHENDIQQHSSYEREHAISHGDHASTSTSETIVNVLHKHSYEKLINSRHCDNDSEFSDPAYNDNSNASHAITSTATDYPVNYCQSSSYDLLNDRQCDKEQNCSTVAMSSHSIAQTYTFSNSFEPQVSSTSCLDFSLKHTKQIDSNPCDFSEPARDYSTSNICSSVTKSTEVDDNHLAGISDHIDPKNLLLSDQFNFNSGSNTSLVVSSDHNSNVNDILYMNNSVEQDQHNSTIDSASTRHNCGSTKSNVACPDRNPVDFCSSLPKYLYPSHNTEISNDLPSITAQSKQSDVPPVVPYVCSLLNQSQASQPYVQQQEHYHHKNMGQKTEPLDKSRSDNVNLCKVSEESFVPLFLPNANSIGNSTCTDNSYLNLINCGTSDRDTEDVLSNVDDLNICLNLVMPQYGAQSSSLADNSASLNHTQTSQNIHYMNHSCNPNINPFNSSLNHSLALNSSALSPINTSLNHSFYPTNFDDFVQSNFPLYSNLPHFHPPNINFHPPDLSLPSVYQHSNGKSISSAGLLASNVSMSPSNLPINLASDSTLCYDPQSSLPSHSVAAPVPVPASIPVPAPISVAAPIPVTPIAVAAPIPVAPIPISLALQPFHSSQISNTHSFSNNLIPSSLSPHYILSHSNPVHSIPSHPYASLSNVSIAPSSQSGVAGPSHSPNQFSENPMQPSVTASNPTHLLSNILSQTLQTSILKSNNVSESRNLPLPPPPQSARAAQIAESSDTQSRSGSPYCKYQRLDEDSALEPQRKCVATPIVDSLSRFSLLGLKPVKCFTKPRRIYSQKLKNSSNILLSCNKCSREFRTTKQLNKHKLSDHEVTSFECNICKAAFRDRLLLREHRLKQCSRRHYSCRYCHRNFSGSSSLAVHRRIHTGELPFTCQECGRRFRHSTTLRNHVLVHSGERPFQCSLCMLRFSQRASLARHMRNHADVATFKCSVCASVLKDKQGLMRHMKMTHFDCDVCEESFCNKRKLDSHVLKSHENDTRPFKCELCPSTFAVKLNSTKHKNSIHRDVDLVCDECGAKFKRTDRLNAHKKIHCKDGSSKVHECDLCHATFNQRNSLSKHNRLMHNDAAVSGAQADGSSGSAEGSAEQ